MSYVSKIFINDLQKRIHTNVTVGLLLRRIFCLPLVEQKQIFRTRFCYFTFARTVTHIHLPKSGGLHSQIVGVNNSQHKMYFPLSTVWTDDQTLTDHRSVSSNQQLFMHLFSAKWEYSFSSTKLWWKSCWQQRIFRWLTASADNVCCCLLTDGLCRKPKVDKLKILWQSTFCYTPYVHARLCTSVQHKENCVQSEATSYGYHCMFSQLLC